MNLEKFMYDKSNDPIRTAILLAMTQDQELERDLIRRYRDMGIPCAVTMISGNDTTAKPKIVRSVIGLCLNEGLIEKKTEHIHPVVHAIWEASYTSRIDSEISQNYCLKVAAVRRKSQFALCFYGNLAVHEFSAHKTVGTGMQILGE